MSWPFYNYIILPHPCRSIYLSPPRQLEVPDTKAPSKTIRRKRHHKHSIRIAILPIFCNLTTMPMRVHMGCGCLWWMCDCQRVTWGKAFPQLIILVFQIYHFAHSMPLTISWPAPTVWSPRHQCSIHNNTEEEPPQSKGKKHPPSHFLQGISTAAIFVFSITSFRPVHATFHLSAHPYSHSQ